MQDKKDRKKYGISRGCPSEFCSLKMQKALGDPFVNDSMRQII